MADAKLKNLVKNLIKNLVKKFAERVVENLTRRLVEKQKKEITKRQNLLPQDNDLNSICRNILYTHDTYMH